MKTDQFEDFIHEHRDKLDDRSPDNKIWEKIDSELGQEDEKGFWKYNWWRVAAIFLLVACAFLVGERMLNKEDENKRLAELETETESDANPDFQEVESYYRGLIQAKQEEIAHFAANADASLMSGFDEDLELLDSLYLQHKEELKQLNNNDNVVNAMIENLKLRVDILNKQIMVLEKIGNIENDETRTI